MISKVDYSHIQFILSAYQLEQLPADHGIEIAFIGRSNAGKSSALNVITGKRNLARVSKTPGRTQAINVFAVNDELRLIDLPGYGYAKVPPEIKLHWEAIIDRYLQHRKSLRGIILLMDIRHPLQLFDRHLLAWANKYTLPVHILLTKADKLNKNVSLRKLHEVTKELEHYSLVTVQAFSSLTKQGVADALLQLDQWLID